MKMMFCSSCRLRRLSAGVRAGARRQRAKLTVSSSARSAIAYGAKRRSASASVPPSTRGLPSSAAMNANRSGGSGSVASSSLNVWS